MKVGPDTPLLQVKRESRKDTPLLQVNRVNHSKVTAATEGTAQNSGPHRAEVSVTVLNDGIASPDGRLFDPTPTGGTPDISEGRSVVDTQIHAGTATQYFLDHTTFAVYSDKVTA